MDTCTPSSSFIFECVFLENNVTSAIVLAKQCERMSKLVEQIRVLLSTIKTLGKMPSNHTKRSQISHDIDEDLIVQGEQIRDTLQELQDVVHLTKVNIVCHNEEALKKMNKTHSETVRSNYSGDYEDKDSIDGSQLSSTRLSLGSRSDDSEVPMPTLAVAPLQTHSISYITTNHRASSVYQHHKKRSCCCSYQKCH